MVFFYTKIKKWWKNKTIAKTNTPENQKKQRKHNKETNKNLVKSRFWSICVLFCFFLVCFLLLLFFFFRFSGDSSGQFFFFLWRLCFCFVFSFCFLFIYCIFSKINFLCFVGLIVIINTRWRIRDRNRLVWWLGSVAGRVDGLAALRTVT